ncbi:2-aminomuconate deaminase [Stenotrophomonas sp. RIT309]|uniref:Rid family hydrolase n=1 Tax=Stenotrophomonas TaxID=40323 RepID=UPI0004471B7A|nr:MULTISPECIES: Rid family hydrolase [Stenotrophomonas]EZP44715.1 2-aminomuconate deaminase [Stenotrophomonas sp. RIT309]WGV53632.1 Rid family hydrolase [Stenotrophomonas indicatrix]
MKAVNKVKTMAVMVVCAATALPVSATDIKRHTSEAIPVAYAVEVPPGRTTVYLSGKLPEPTGVGAPLDYGDTRTQTISVLRQIHEQLASIGLRMEDLVKLQVYLVGGEETGGRMDLAGFAAGYSQFFGSPAKSTALPARSTFQVAGLAHPAQRVEIEAIAVRP